MSTAMDFLNDNAGGTGEDHPSVYLGEVGRKIVGTITTTPRTVETTFGPRLVVDLTAVEGTNCRKGKNGADGDVTVGETVTVWIRPGNQAGAVRDAIGEAQAAGLEMGGTLALALVEQRDVGKGNPLNVHKAQYKSPVAAVAVSDDLI